jgi:hypothetical protein
VSCWTRVPTSTDPRRTFDDTTKRRDVTDVTTADLPVLPLGERGDDGQGNRGRVLAVSRVRSDLEPVAALELSIALSVSAMSVGNGHQSSHPGLARSERHRGVIPQHTS